MNTAGRPDVVVVVVTFDAPDDLAACLESLNAHGGVSRIVLVDNGGRAQLPEQDGLLVVTPRRNNGFGAGANLGFERASGLGGDVIVLLNDDVVVTDGWLDGLLAELLDDATVGAVQPMLVFAGSDRVNSLGVVVGANGAGNDEGLGEGVGDVDRTPRSIDVFTGGAVAFRRAFLESTGGFDERYFLYYEDVDLARRGARLGWRYRCAPASVVEHAKGATTDSLGDRLVYLRERNRLWSAFRNESFSTVRGAVWLSVRRLRHRPYLVHGRALVVGVGGGLWRLVERVRARRR